MSRNDCTAQTRQEMEGWKALEHRAQTGRQHRREAGPTETLADVAAIAYLLDVVTRGAVDQARSQGQSWSEIGHALGVSKQAAQQRFTPKTPRPVQKETLPIQ